MPGHLFVEEVDTAAIDVLKASVPYVPTQSVPAHNADCYTEAERDRFLDGIFATYPQWYLFICPTYRAAIPVDPSPSARTYRLETFPTERASFRGEPRRHGGHSIKTIQAQPGHRSAQSTHRYAHLGGQAQLRLVEDSGPTSPPHVNVRSTTGRCLDD